MNFTKDLVLCEIIERHESKSIGLLLLFFFFVGLSYRMTQFFDCHGVCMNECEIAIITLLILITYIGHFFAFKFLLLTLKMMRVFRGYRFIS